MGDATQCRPKRIAQTIFNTLFTMDMWSDLTVALDLVFGKNTKLGLASALFFFCFASPVDYANLCMRISYSLEDLPDRSHLLNILFEIPMLAFNLFLVLGYAQMSRIWWTAPPRAGVACRSSTFGWRNVTSETISCLNR
ncbi:MAG: hypothetical protein HC767_02805 [Akkermansiaceae bacterium]|nr:hypothetical protein [Akkermansiaceae bacterium]